MEQFSQYIKQKYLLSLAALREYEFCSAVALVVISIVCVFVLHTNKNKVGFQESPATRNLITWIHNLRHAALGNLTHFSLHHSPQIACYAFLYFKKNPDKTFDPNVQRLYRITASGCCKTYLFYITKCCMVWCMGVLVSLGTPKSLRDAIPVALCSGTGTL